MYGGVGDEHLISRVSCRAHVDLTRNLCDIHLMDTPATASNHSTCNGVSVRQLCEIWIFNANAGGQKRTWLDAWTLHNIRVLHVLHTYKLISSKLCRHCAATEHDLGRSGSKDKPAFVDSNSASNLQHARSKPCKRGPLPVCAARRGATHTVSHLAPARVQTANVELVLIPCTTFM